MLQHRTCPHCGEQSLATEVMCFACGEPLGRRPRPRERPPIVPWLLWAGLLVLVAALGLTAVYAVRFISASQSRCAIPMGRMLLLGGGLLVAGQVAFYQARRDDRRWWELKRAPQLPLTQAEAGDAVWVRGRIACESPLVLPVPAPIQECVYYHLVVKERDYRGRWRVTQNEKRAVDFTLVADSESVYVPTGNLLYDAPIYVDPGAGLLGDERVTVWALAVGWKASVCGRVTEGPPRRLERLSDQTPAVVTWQLPSGYVEELAKRGRQAQLLGTGLTVIAALVAITAITHQ